MNKAPHTPGPWSVVADPHKEIGQPDVQRWSVRQGKIPIIDGYFLREEDARLSAASPDMLAALKLISGMDISHEALAIVDAAIAKAEGQS